jgi:hypothetical protein
MLLSGVLCSAALGQRNPHSTAPLECSDVDAGQIVTRKTALMTVRSGAVRAYAVVQLSRANDDEEADSCTVVYKLFVAEGSKPFVSVKEYSERADSSVGVGMVGASKSEMVIAADFWWAAGDYTGHRPVIYDLNSKSAVLRTLKDEILRRLPSCDYFEEFIGVTDNGEAVIRIPKSTYVEKGCPAQGEWLFDVHSGSVRRMK